MALQSLSLPSKVDWRIKSNIITLKDIRTRKRFWLKPHLDPRRISNTGKEYYINPYWSILPKNDNNPEGYIIPEGGGKVLVPIENPTAEQMKRSSWVNYDYFNLKIFPRWYYWQPDYWMLPEPDRWEQIVERIIGTIGRKDKDGKQKPDPEEEPIWDTLEDEQYYILNSGDNIMTVILQNRKQYDWARPDCVFFFGRNTFSPKGQKWREEKAHFEIEWYKRRTGDSKKKKDKDGKETDAEWKDLMGSDMPLMYWVKSWRYINTSTLFAEVVLEKCYIWHYFGNWMNTWYTAKINKSNLNNDHINYAGNPITVFNEPGKQIRDGQRPHDKHWPMDWDWYVMRAKTPEDDKTGPFWGVAPEPDELTWPGVTKGAEAILKAPSYLAKKGGVGIEWLRDKYRVFRGKKPLGKKEDIDDTQTVQGGWVDKGKEGIVWEEKFPDNWIIDESVAPAHHCPACDACFTFCGDLRLKKAMAPVEGGDIGKWKEVPAHATWQPGYCLGYTTFPSNTERVTNPTLNTTVSVVADEKGKVVSAVPTNMQISRFNPGDAMLDTSPKAPTLLFLLDEDHDKVDPEKLKIWFPDIVWDVFKKLKDGLLISANGKRHPKNIRKYHWSYLPQCFRDQPHLLVHSTCQFYFQYKLLFTANCKHVWIRRKGAGFALGYRVLVRSSISGILYCFESLDIFYKWEVKVRGNVVNIGLLNALWASVTSNLANKALSWLGEKGKAFAKKIPYVGGFISSFLGGSKQETLEKIAKVLEEIAHGGGGTSMGGDDYAERLGAVNKHEEPKNAADKSDQEAQTERRTKQTFKTMAREVYNSIFYTNTIDFSYDFWEFANRCVANPFMIRFEYSEILYNNLVNNNNAYPIQSFEIRGNRFCQIVKTGDFQADVRLGFDIKDRNLFRGICARGVTWYNEGTDWDTNGNIISDWFVPWVPRYKALQSYTIGASFNANTQQGAEDTVTKPGEDTVDPLGSSDPDKREVGYVTYFRCSTPALFGDFLNAGLTSHHTNSSGFDNAYCLKTGRGVEGGALCWGCNYRDHIKGKGTVRITLTPGSGRWVGSILEKQNTSTGPEAVWNIPDVATAILIHDNGQWQVLKQGEGTSETTYKGDTIQGIQGLQFAQRENKEPVWDDKNTNAGSGIGSYEPDKMPELDDPEKDPKETMFDKPEGEAREKGGDLEKDFDTELEKDRENKEQEKREREAQKEAEKDRERELMREQEKDKQEERERKDRERKDREDKEKKREQDKRDREKKERQERVRKDLERKAREAKEKRKKETEKGS